MIHITHKSVLYCRLYYCNFTIISVESLLQVEVSATVCCILILTSVENIAFLTEYFSVILQYDL